MPYPPRLAHLATRAVVSAKLFPSYSEAQKLEDDEAKERLSRALAGPLWERLLENTWEALLGDAKRLDEAGLLEKVARSLGERPLRPGRATPDSPEWNAFWLELELEAGTVSETARRVLEGDAGKQLMKKGRTAAGRFLAAELTR